MTKREMVAKLDPQDLNLLADAAEKAATIKHFNAKDLKRINKTIKLVRKVKGAQ